MHAHKLLLAQSNIDLLLKLFHLNTKNKQQKICNKAIIKSIVIGLLYRRKYCSKKTAPHLDTV